MREDHGARTQATAADPDSPSRGSASRPGPRGVVGNGALWLLRLVTAAALAVDAYVHADLAPTYDPNRATFSQGMLFRVEAGAAALAALLVIVAGRRWLVWAFAFLVAAGGLFAVMLYRYVDVGAFGPFPDMYEPVWYAEKTRSAIAEAIGTGTALIGFVYVYSTSARRFVPGRLRRRGQSEE